MKPVWFVRLDAMLAVAGDDDRTLFAPGQCRDLGMAANPVQCCLEVVDLIERTDFRFVGEEDIDMVRPPARGTRRDNDPRRTDRTATGLPSVPRRARSWRPCGRLPGARRIEQIAFEIGHLRGRDEVGIDILGPQFDAGAEIGVHGALRVGRDQDQAARGGGSARQRRGVERDPDGAQIVREDAAELIVPDLADIGALTPQRGDAGHGVAAGAPRGLDPGAHRGVKRRGALLVDQRHGPLVKVVLRQEVVVGGDQNIDNGVADADDIEGFRRHEFFPACSMEARGV